MVKQRLFSQMVLKKQLVSRPGQQHLQLQYGRRRSSAVTARILPEAPPEGGGSILFFLLSCCLYARFTTALRVRRISAETVVNLADAAGSPAVPPLLGQSCSSLACRIAQWWLRHRCTQGRKASPHQAFTRRHEWMDPMSSDIELLPGTERTASALVPCTSAAAD